MRQMVKGAIPSGVALAVLQTREKVMKSKIFRWGLTAMMAGTLAACGGGGSSDTTTPTTGAGGGTTTTTTAPTVAVPTGTAPVTLTAATPAATFAALTPAVPAVAVTINSPPKVTFSLTDGNGNPIIGFGSKSQSATATVASYSNLAFSLAKLVPGANGAPSKWVNYIVTTVPTYKSATDKTIVPAAPRGPIYDREGTLVDNGNGTYTYTFYRDITKVKDEVAAATLTAPNVAADLGDLTYDPNLVHRLTIEISGYAPGTGTNTADGVQVTAGVRMANPINVIYDFIPATGKAVTATDPSREIVAIAKCNECHGKLAMHGAGKIDTRYCVVCHTDQRKYGRSEATTTATGYDATKGTYLVNGISVGNFPTEIHKIHMGEELTKTGYNYANVKFNDVKFPQDIRNCTKCHDGSATSNAKTANGDNWKSVPTRLACGACHDGINFATGKGTTLADAALIALGKTPTGVGHIGGAKADDSQCALCHDATTIPVYHVPVSPVAASIQISGVASGYTNAASVAANQDNLPSGAIKVTYDVQSVSRNASKQPVIVFRILQNGARADFNTYSATGKTELWDNFVGSPSAYFVYAVPQDGIAAPADFNVSVSSPIKRLWNGILTAATQAGTLTGPDASGYYTATLTGVTVPDNAVMLTGGIGFTYDLPNNPPLAQINLADYSYNATSKIGGLIVAAPTVQKVATGYTARRQIVENARCNKCHEKLGVFTAAAFHAGQRNDANTCAWCHRPNQTSSGWSADSEVFVHGIHGASKRSVAFTWHAVSATDNYSTIGYPGILKNCETCHLPGTYDFSASASASALPNRLYRTVGQGKYNAATDTAKAISPYVTADNVADYGTGFSFNAATGVTTAAAGTTLVNSPIAAACFSCHDSDLAKSHMTSNGGSLYEARTTALAKTEQCTLCHLAGKVADIKTMHAK